MWIVIGLITATLIGWLGVRQVMGVNVVGQPAGAADHASALDHVVKDIEGNDHDLAQHKGKVVMIVNVASKCGMTPQYAQLQKLYEAHKDRGLVIIGFPANDFGNQEPGSDEEIAAFCTEKFDVTFPMMSKITVKGEGKHPVYAHLTSEASAGEYAGEIKWNFTKFVLDRNGRIIARFAPNTKPDDPKVLEVIKAALAADAR
ncbi:MAG TPA: glutathione peroxidase [Tepidisphaeraceae bacterium]|nr:glutathione peroxidase [Tepidisphaeraceae bacterium]